MSLIGLFIFIVVIGLIYYLVTLLPLAAPFKTIAIVILILFAIVYLATSFGLIGTGPIRLR